MSQEIENLLKQTTLINEKYKEIAKITGENYNIFGILNLGSKERRLHSAFIANLLDPNGSHGLDRSFLNDFIDCLPLEKFNLNKSLIQRIETEKHIPKINREIFDGGYIDILLSGSNINIIIENKIYAGDQRMQLYRYHKAYKSAPIIYLSLFKKDPTDDKELIHEELKKEGIESELERENYIGVFKEQIICITYHTEVLQWLERCKKLTVDRPILRETITQYMHLLKDLTNQTTNKKMEKDLLELMSNQVNVEASLEIANNIVQMKNKLFEEKFVKKIDESFNLNKKAEWSFIYTTDNIYRWLTFKSDKTTSLNFVRVALKNDFTGGWIGIYNSTPNQDNRVLYEAKLKNQINSIGKYQTWGLFVFEFSDLSRFFSKKECWYLIASNNIQGIIDNIIVNVNIMITAIEEVQNETLKKL